MQYLKYIGELTMRDSFNNCLKACMTDKCCMSYTYWGTPTAESFYDKRIATAIFGMFVRYTIIEIKMPVIYFLNKIVWSFIVLNIFVVEAVAANRTFHFNQHLLISKKK